jgi:two-component system sensor histidine kinase VicK
LNLDEEKFKQLEQKYGLNAPEKTEVILGFENMLEMTRYGFSIVNNGFDCLWDAEFVSILPTYFADGVRDATNLVTKKGIKIRVITEVKEDNLESVIQISKLFDVRHLQGVKGNFGILDRRQYIVVMFSSYDKPPEQGLFSNSKKFVEQQQYVFDTLWESAISANVKIRQIEMASEPEFIKDDLNRQETNKVLNELIDCSTKGILILLPTPESFIHLKEQGILDALKSATIREVDIRIVIAGVDIDGVTYEGDVQKFSKNITIRYLSTELPNNRVDIVIDYKFTVSFEESYGKSTPSERALGLATYSNVESKAMVSSSIFENYWMRAR